MTQRNKDSQHVRQCSTLSLAFSTLNAANSKQLCFTDDGGYNLQSSPYDDIVTFTCSSRIRNLPC